jgi:hypothetical protein
VKFTIVRGSSRPVLEILLTDRSDAPIDLTDATAARFVAASVVETASGALSISKSLTFGVRAAGQMFAEWVSADTNIPSGTYKAQVEVDFIDGSTGKWRTNDIVIEASVKQ